MHRLTEDQSCINQKWGEKKYMTNKLMLIFESLHFKFLFISPLYF